MTGIQYVVDDNGERKAVILDLEQLGDLWEDICDYLSSRTREVEETVRWDQVKADLKLESPRVG